jgi:hypothetical protein
MTIKANLVLGSEAMLVFAARGNDDEAFAEWAASHGYAVTQMTAQTLNGPGIVVLRRSAFAFVLAHNQAFNFVFFNPLEEYGEDDDDTLLAQQLLGELISSKAV